MLKFIAKQEVYFIDDFLNSTTMYRLVLYILIGYLAVALVLSFFKLLPFSPVNLIFSAGVLIIVCWTTNKLFAKAFNAPTNLESVYITALILSLIITPINSLSQLLYLAAASVLAISSKYILAIKKKHIFNPAAFGVFLTFLIFKFGASWWVGNAYMLIPVLMGGLLVVRKVRRLRMVVAFLVVYTVFAGPHLIQIILESPIFFFSLIMLTEPQTMPPRKNLQIIYGGLVGLISVFQAPEIALLVGNIFVYIFSPKEKLILKLKEKIQIGPDIYEYVFNGKLNFLAGQYLEWTLGQKNPDSRGSRRYFTLASSPTEDNLRLGIKFYLNGSSFKNSLFNMKIGNQIVAASLSGEFNLPKDINKKLVFIAGGIGVTPFRSMIKFLLDTNQKRDIILLYSNKTQSDIVYKDILNQVRTVYVNTDKQGFIDEKMIRREAPDFKERTFYLSGPHSMVDVFEKTLKKMGIQGNQIKIDFFPGYA